MDIYDIRTSQWQSNVGNLSEPRYFSAGAALGSLILIAGGANSINVSAVVDIFDINSKQWSISTLSEARTQLAASAAGTKVVFAGGAVYVLLIGESLLTLPIVALPFAPPQRWTFTILQLVYGAPQSLVRET